MQLDAKIEALQNFIKHKITYEEIAAVLGITRSAVGNRIQRKQPLKEFEEQKLDDFFLAKAREILTQNSTSPIQSMINELQTFDRVEINYWRDLPDDLKNPRIASVWFDKEIIENAWGMRAEHLCIVPMIGDKMAHYWYPIRPNDILIVDTSQDYIMGNGVYFGVSRNNTRFWIREMQVLINNDIEFKGFSPSGDTTKTLSKDQLDEAGFKLIGKVIKNVSFRL